MKTALITGASGGIGAGLAVAFSKAGYSLALSYNNNEKAVKGLCESLPNAKAFHCDVADFAQVENLYTQVMGEFSHLDVVVNNAGVAFQGLVQDMAQEDIIKVITTDLNGTIYSCRSAAKYMVKAHRGSIINISSVWGVVGASCEGVYSAAKGGVITFTKALAKELGPSGIRVNCISPGVIKTPMLDIYTDEDLQVLCQETPLGRIGTPEDVANAAIFLAAEQASFITGHNLVVDGGFAL